VNKQKIMLAHGNGGLLMQQLINRLFISNFSNKVLNRLDDSAVLSLNNKGKKVAFTTDSFVVNPIFFSGGDIGKLAVCGTVNDLSMMGAKPLFLSAGVIIEEGFEIKQLEKIVSSMHRTLKEAGVEIVCGDTKVVNKGACDKIFINTAGIGTIDEGVDIHAARARAKDTIIVSGPVAEHGISILSQREGLAFKTKLKSDCAPLNSLVADMLKFSKSIHVLRDPTRGGLATALNEIAVHSNVGIEISEKDVPVLASVKGACEILGLDPLYLACEGRLVAFVAPDEAKHILRAMRNNRYAKNATIIGQAVSRHKKEVYLNTLTGSNRILDVQVEEQMPRIC